MGWIPGGSLKADDCKKPKGRARAGKRCAPRFISGKSASLEYAYWCTKTETHPAGELACDSVNVWCDDGGTLDGWVKPIANEYKYWCRTGEDVTSEFIECGGIDGTNGGSAVTGSATAGVPELYSTTAHATPHWVSRDAVSFTAAGTYAVCIVKSDGYSYTLHPTLTLSVTADAAITALTLNGGGGKTINDARAPLEEAPAGEFAVAGGASGDKIKFTRTDSCDFPTAASSIMTTGWSYVAATETVTRRHLNIAGITTGIVLDAAGLTTAGISFPENGVYSLCHAAAASPTSFTLYPTLTVTVFAPWHRRASTANSASYKSILSSSTFLLDSPLRTASSYYGMPSGGGPTWLDSTNKWITNARPVDSMVSSNSGWSPATEDSAPWVMLDMGELRMLRGVQTHGHKDAVACDCWTASYKISHSVDGTTWSSYETFAAANEDHEGAVINYLSGGPVLTRYLRVFPLTTGGSVRTALRFAPLVVGLDTANTTSAYSTAGNSLSWADDTDDENPWPVETGAYFAMTTIPAETGAAPVANEDYMQWNVPYGQRSFSSAKDKTRSVWGLLAVDGVKGGWVPATNTILQEWYQLDLSTTSSLPVLGVATQGRANSAPDTSNWVTQFAVHTSTGGARGEWTFQGSFKGNVDTEYVVNSIFPNGAVRARHVRIWPEAHSAGGIGLRAAVLLAASLAQTGPGSASDITEQGAGEGSAYTLKPPSQGAVDGRYISTTGWCSMLTLASSFRDEKVWYEVDLHSPRWIVGVISRGHSNAASSDSGLVCNQVLAEFIVKVSIDGVTFTAGETVPGVSLADYTSVSSTSKQAMLNNPLFGRYVRAYPTVDGIKGTNWRWDGSSENKIQAGLRLGVYVSSPDVDWEDTLSQDDYDATYDNIAASSVWSGPPAQCDCVACAATAHSVNTGSCGAASSACSATQSGTGCYTAAPFTGCNCVTRVPVDSVIGRGQFGLARLAEISGAWVSATTAVGTEWLQITVGAKPRNVYGVVTKGNAGPGFANAYVSAFTVKSYNPMFAGRHDPHNPLSAFVDVDGGRIFRGNSDAKTAVRTAFRRPTFAQDIRVYPHEASALQTYKWDAPLNQRSNPTPFADDGNGPYDDASMASANGWCGATDGLTAGVEWLQIDAGATVSIAGITAAGARLSHSSNSQGGWFIKVAKVKYSTDGSTWTPASNGNDMPFNTHPNVWNDVLFSEGVVQARFVRVDYTKAVSAGFSADSFGASVWPCLRWGLILHRAPFTMRLGLMLAPILRVRHASLLDSMAITSSPNCSATTGASDEATVVPSAWRAATIALSGQHNFLTKSCSLGYEPNKVSATFGNGNYYNARIDCDETRTKDVLHVAGRKIYAIIAGEYCGLRHDPASLPVDANNKRRSKDYALIFDCDGLADEFYGLTNERGGNSATLTIPSTDFGKLNAGVSVTQTGSGATGTLATLLTAATTTVVVTPTSNIAFDTTNAIIVGGHANKPIPTAVAETDGRGKGAWANGASSATLTLTRGLRTIVSGPDNAGDRGYVNCHVRGIPCVSSANEDQRCKFPFILADNSKADATWPMQAIFYDFTTYRLDPAGGGEAHYTDKDLYSFCPINDRNLRTAQEVNAVTHDCFKDHCGLCVAVGGDGSSSACSTHAGAGSEPTVNAAAYPNQKHFCYDRLPAGGRTAVLSNRCQHCDGGIGEARLVCEDLEMSSAAERRVLIQPTGFHAMMKQPTPWPSQAGMKRNGQYGPNIACTACCTLNADGSGGAGHHCAAVPANPTVATIADDAPVPKALISFVEDPRVAFKVSANHTVCLGTRAVVGDGLNRPKSTDTVATNNGQAEARSVVGTPFPTRGPSGLRGDPTKGISADAVEVEAGTMFAAGALTVTGEGVGGGHIMFTRGATGDFPGGAPGLPNAIGCEHTTSMSSAPIPLDDMGTTERSFMLEAIGRMALCFRFNTSTTFAPYNVFVKARPRINGTAATMQPSAGIVYPAGSLWLGPTSAEYEEVQHLGHESASADSIRFTPSNDCHDENAVTLEGGRPVVIHVSNTKHLAIDRDLKKTKCTLSPQGGAVTRYKYTRQVVGTFLPEDSEVHIINNNIYKQIDDQWCVLSRQESHADDPTELRIMFFDCFKTTAANEDCMMSSSNVAGKEGRVIYDAPKDKKIYFEHASPTTGTLWMQWGSGEKAANSALPEKCVFKTTKLRCHDYTDTSLLTIVPAHPGRGMYSIRRPIIFPAMGTYRLCISHPYGAAVAAGPTAVSATARSANPATAPHKGCNGTMAYATGYCTPDAHHFDYDRFDSVYIRVAGPMANVTAGLTLGGYTPTSRVTVGIHGPAPPALYTTTGFPLQTSLFFNKYNPLNMTGPESLCDPMDGQRSSTRFTLMAYHGLSVPSKPAVTITASLGASSNQGVQRVAPTQFATTSALIGTFKSADIDVHTAVPGVRAVATLRFIVNFETGTSTLRLRLPGFTGVAGANTIRLGSPAFRSGGAGSPWLASMPLLPPFADFENTGGVSNMLIRLGSTDDKAADIWQTGSTVVFSIVDGLTTPRVAPTTLGSPFLSLDDAQGQSMASRAVMVLAGIRPELKFTLRLHNRYQLDDATFNALSELDTQGEIVYHLSSATDPSIAGMLPHGSLLITDIRHTVVKPVRYNTWDIHDGLVWHTIHGHDTVTIDVTARMASTATASAVVASLSPLYGGPEQTADLTSRFNATLKGSLIKPVELHKTPHFIDAVFRENVVGGVFTSATLQLSNSIAGKAITMELKLTAAVPLAVSDRLVLVLDNFTSSDSDQLFTAEHRVGATEAAAKADITPATTQALWIPANNTLIMTLSKAVPNGSFAVLAIPTFNNPPATSRVGQPVSITALGASAQGVLTIKCPTYSIPLPARTGEFTSVSITKQTAQARQDVGWIKLSIVATNALLGSDRVVFSLPGFTSFQQQAVRGFSSVHLVETGIVGSGTSATVNTSGVAWDPVAATLTVPINASASVPKLATISIELGAGMLYNPGKATIEVQATAIALDADGVTVITERSAVVTQWVDALTVTGGAFTHLEVGTSDGTAGESEHYMTVRFSLNINITVNHRVIVYFPFFSSTSATSLTSIVGQKAGGNFSNWASLSTTAARDGWTPQSGMLNAAQLVVAPTTNHSFGTMLEFAFAGVTNPATVARDAGVGGAVMFNPASAFVVTRTASRPALAVQGFLSELSISSPDDGSTLPAASSTLHVKFRATQELRAGDRLRLRMTNFTGTPYTGANATVNTTLLNGQGLVELVTKLAFRVDYTLEPVVNIMFPVVNVTPGVNGTIAVLTFTIVDQTHEPLDGVECDATCIAMGNVIIPAGALVGMTLAQPVTMPVDVGPVSIRGVVLGSSTQSAYGADQVLVTERPANPETELFSVEGGVIDPAGLSITVPAAGPGEKTGPVSVAFRATNALAPGLGALAGTAHNGSDIIVLRLPRGFTAPSGISIGSRTIEQDGSNDASLGADILPANALFDATTGDIFIILTNTPAGVNENTTSIAPLHLIKFTLGGLVNPASPQREVQPSLKVTDHMGRTKTALAMLPAVRILGALTRDSLAMADSRGGYPSVTEDRNPMTVSFVSSAALESGDVVVLTLPQFTTQSSSSTQLVVTAVSFNGAPQSTSVLNAAGVVGGLQAYFHNQASVASGTVYTFTVVGLVTPPVPVLSPAVAIDIMDGSDGVTCCGVVNGKTFASVPTICTGTFILDKITLANPDPSEVSSATMNFAATSALEAGSKLVVTFTGFAGVPAGTSSLVVSGPNITDGVISAGAFWDPLTGEGTLHVLKRVPAYHSLVGVTVFSLVNPNIVGLTARVSIKGVSSEGIESITDKLFASRPRLPVKIQADSIAFAYTYVAQPVGDIDIEVTPLTDAESGTVLQITMPGFMRSAGLLSILLQERCPRGVCATASPLFLHGTASWDTATETLNILFIDGVASFTMHKFRIGAGLSGPTSAGLTSPTLRITDSVGGAPITTTEIFAVRPSMTGAVFLAPLKAQVAPPTGSFVDSYLILSFRVSATLPPGSFLRVTLPGFTLVKQNPPPAPLPQGLNLFQGLLEATTPPPLSPMKHGASWVVGTPVPIHANGTTDFETSIGLTSTVVGKPALLVRLPSGIGQEIVDSTTYRLTVYNLQNPPLDSGRPFVGIAVRAVGVGAPGADPMHLCNNTAAGCAEELARYQTVMTDTIMQGSFSEFVVQLDSAYTNHSDVTATVTATVTNDLEATDYLMLVLPGFAAGFPSGISVALVGGGALTAIWHDERCIEHYTRPVRLMASAGYKTTCAATVGIQLGAAIVAGTQFQVTVSGLRNPSAATDPRFGVSTAGYVVSQSDYAPMWLEGTYKMPVTGYHIQCNPYSFTSCPVARPRIYGGTLDAGTSAITYTPAGGADMQTNVAMAEIKVTAAFSVDLDGLDSLIQVALPEFTWGGVHDDYTANTSAPWRDRTVRSIAVRGDGIYFNTAVVGASVSWIGNTSIVEVPVGRTGPGVVGTTIIPAHTAASFTILAGLRSPAAVQLTAQSTVGVRLRMGSRRVAIWAQPPVLVESTLIADQPVISGIFTASTIASAAAAAGALAPTWYTIVLIASTRLQKMNYRYPYTPERLVVYLPGAFPANSPTAVIDVMMHTSFNGTSTTTEGQFPCNSSLEGGALILPVPEDAVGGTVITLEIGRHREGFPDKVGDPANDMSRAQLTNPPGPTYVPSAAVWLIDEATSALLAQEVVTRSLFKERAISSGGLLQDLEVHMGSHIAGLGVPVTMSFSITSGAAPGLIIRAHLPGFLGRTGLMTVSNALGQSQRQGCTGPYPLVASGLCVQAQSVPASGSPEYSAAYSVTLGLISTAAMWDNAQKILTVPITGNQTGIISLGCTVYGLANPLSPHTIVPVTVGVTIGDSTIGGTPRWQAPPASPVSAVAISGKWRTKTISWPYHTLSDKIGDMSVEATASNELVTGDVILITMANFVGPTTGTVELGSRHVVDDDGAALPGTGTWVPPVAGEGSASATQDGYFRIVVQAPGIAADATFSFVLKENAGAPVRNPPAVVATPTVTISAFDVNGNIVTELEHFHTAAGSQTRLTFYSNFGGFTPSTLNPAVEGALCATWAAELGLPESAVRMTKRTAARVNVRFTTSDRRRELGAGATGEGETEGEGVGVTNSRVLVSVDGDIDVTMAEGKEQDEEEEKKEGEEESDVSSAEANNKEARRLSHINIWQDGVNIQFEADVPSLAEAASITTSLSYIYSIAGTTSGGFKILNFAQATIAQRTGTLTPITAFIAPQEFPITTTVLTFPDMAVYGKFVDERLVWTSLGAGRLSGDIAARCVNGGSGDSGGRGGRGSGGSVVVLVVLVCITVLLVCRCLDWLYTHTHTHTCPHPPTPTRTSHLPRSPSFSHTRLPRPLRFYPALK